jgi:N-acetylglucosaminyldiphosphoundecaprenol N-acetyl-beta-D-mannosaminyltransferase
MDKVNVLGVRVASVCLQDVLDIICETIAENQRALIVHVNVMGALLAYENEWMRRFLNASDLVYCDGMGVKLGAKLLGYDIPERFTLADWVWQLAALAEKEGFSIFLLGNPPGVAEAAAVRLRERMPNLRIAGAQHGYFEKSPDHPENLAVLEKINAAGADILLVGFGMPIQEKWLQENWDHLEVHVAISVGALFEYVAGELKRGPRWMTQHYMEWLARMVISPRRYANRYLHDAPLFLYRILHQKFFGLNESDYKGETVRQ